MKAFMVAVVLGATPEEGKLFLQAILAPSAQAALASCVAQFARQCEGPVQSYNVRELSAEFLERAAEAARTVH